MGGARPAAGCPPTRDGRARAAAGHRGAPTAAGRFRFRFWFRCSGPVGAERRLALASVRGVYTPAVPECAHTQHQHKQVSCSLTKLLNVLLEHAELLAESLSTPGETPDASLLTAPPINAAEHMPCECAVYNTKIMQGQERHQESSSGKLMHEQSYTHVWKQSYDARNRYSTCTLELSLITPLKTTRLVIRIPAGIAG